VALSRGKSWSCPTRGADPIVSQDLRQTDLLFEQGALLEAKTAERLTPAHRSQTLSYLFLAGLHHARLVNLRPEKVEYEFISTGLTHEARQRFHIADQAWEKANSESLWLKEALHDLLSDWGAFLEVSLYREAITHFLGGVERVVRPVEVFSNGGSLGFQPMHLLAADTAFVFTGVTDLQQRLRDHQLRFLRHTPLRYIQWVNFNRHNIEFETLKKTDST
jgi:hypothetical protein